MRLLKTHCLGSERNNEVTDPREGPFMNVQWAVKLGKERMEVDRKGMPVLSSPTSTTPVFAQMACDTVKNRSSVHGELN